MLTHPLEVLAAFAEAQELMNTLGEEHPRTLMAVIKALNLADPTLVARKAKECGLELPAATHIGEDGEALFSSDAVADAMGQPHDDVLRLIDGLQDDGVGLNVVPAHRIQ